MSDFDFFNEICPIKVHFKRTFKDGNLAGLTIDQKVSFPNLDCAKRWIEGVRRNCKEIHDPVVVNAEVR